MPYWFGATGGGKQKPGCLTLIIGFEVNVGTDAIRGRRRRVMQETLRLAKQDKE